jgi:hypothetical protein
MLPSHAEANIRMSFSTHLKKLMEPENDSAHRKLAPWKYSSPVDTSADAA